MASRGRSGTQFQPFDGTLYASPPVHSDGSALLVNNALSCVNGGDFSFSMWFKLAAQPSTNTFWISDPDNSAQAFDINYNNQFELNLSGPGGASRLLLVYSSSPFYGAWHHLIGSFNTNLAAHSKLYAVYIDGVLQTPVVVEDDGAAFVAPFNGKKFAVLNGTFDDGVVGEFADIWIAVGQTLLTGNAISRDTLAKFRNSSNKPLDLGPTGAAPTGIAPTVFFSGDSTTFKTNKGTGGAFTFTGTLGNASSGPS